MIRLEIHPREGGADSELFARDLGAAIAKHTGTPMTTEGRIVVLERL